MGDPRLSDGPGTGTGDPCHNNGPGTGRAPAVQLPLEGQRARCSPPQPRAQASASRRTEIAVPIPKRISTTVS